VEAFAYVIFREIIDKFQAKLEFVSFGFGHLKTKCIEILDLSFKVNIPLTCIFLPFLKAALMLAILIQLSCKVMC